MPFKLSCRGGRHMEDNILMLGREFAPAPLYRLMMIDNLITTLFWKACFSLFILQEIMNRFYV